MGFEFLKDLGRAAKEIGTDLVGGEKNAKKLKGVLREWDEEADRRVDKRCLIGS
jgi:hypothetical protein